MMNVIISNNISRGTNYILLILFLYHILKKLHHFFDNNSATYFQYTKNVSCIYKHQMQIQCEQNRIFLYKNNSE